MKKVIGSEIWVYLRSSANTVGDIFGLLVDVDDDSLYVQSFDSNNPTAYIIPRDNIKYCTTTAIPSTNLAIDTTEKPVNKQQQEAVEHTQHQKKEDIIAQYLAVHVNKELIARIPVTPTFNLNSWHDNIMKIVMGNPDVQTILANRTLKDLEYSPGEVYIELSEEEQSQLPQEDIDDGKNSFSMSNGPGGDIATKFVSSTQMITRLNAAVKRGKKNDDETKV